MKTEIEDGSRRPTTNYDHYEVIDDGFTLLTRGKQTGDPAVLQVCQKAYSTSAKLKIKAGEDG